MSSLSDPSLLDPCLAGGRDPMTLAEALRLLGEAFGPVAEPETVPLARADGRVLAADLVAPLRLPPFDNAAMDGYAARFADLAEGVRTVLPVLGRIAAGDAPAIASSGTAVRIFTGAPLPAGHDVVVPQEIARIEPDGRVSLPAGLLRGANTRRAGEDVEAGRVAIPAGRRLRPQEVALLGALGIEAVSVRRRLRVAVFSTGNEVAPGDAPLGPGGLHDANGPGLLALLRRFGCETLDGGVLPDEPLTVREALRDAGRAMDLVLTSGGVSEGEEDHVRAAVAAEGAIAFWKLALKPGKPVAFGRVGPAAFLGLPGNPVSAFVTFCMLGRPLLARLAGEMFRPPLGFQVPAGFSRRKAPGRREYLRASLSGPEGRTVLRLFPREGSGLITSLTESDGLIELPEEAGDIAEGDLLRFLPYGSLLA